MPTRKIDGKNHLDTKAIREWLTDRAPSIVFIEKAQAMPAFRGRCFKCRIDTKPITELNLLVRGLKPKAIGQLEKIQVCPRCLGGESTFQGSTGTFNTGHGYGLLCGILIGLGYSDDPNAERRYETISPQSWTTIFRQCYTPGEGKERSVNLSKQLWPRFDFRATAKSFKPHHGITDACLICYVGLSRQKSATLKAMEAESAF